jgi:hypothetical protein
VPEVDTVTGAATLACSVGMLGPVNCYLVRITGRPSLSPSSDPRHEPVVPR